VAGAARPGWFLAACARRRDCLREAASDDGWRRRPDMDPPFTRCLRASIVAHDRCTDDLVMEEAARASVSISSSGLALKVRSSHASSSRLRIVEVDQSGLQALKGPRPIELESGIPEWLPLVSIDLEAGGCGGEVADYRPRQTSACGRFFTRVFIRVSKDTTAAILR
jgi:hypothetical protein